MTLCVYVWFRKGRFYERARATYLSDVSRRLLGQLRATATLLTVFVLHQTFLPRRVMWALGEPLQKMMSTPSYGHCFTAPELWRYLDLSEPAVRSVLQPSECTLSHKEFLSTFGIKESIFCHKAVWYLLGCGNLASLREADCVELLNADPRPIYCPIYC